MMTHSMILCTAAALLLAFCGTLTAAPKAMPNPDFTKGESIPEGANHDWNLGATGMRGWMYTDTLSTTDARQIYITQVTPGTPADGVVAVGDVLLGVAGKPFSYDPRTEMGKALTTAESEAGGGKLSLIRWRKGETKTVTLTLPVLGTYSATAPYDCPKSRRILEQGCRVLAKRIADPAYSPNPIPRCLNALALLASGDEQYLPLVKKEARWAANFSEDSMQTWYYGYASLLVSEYVMRTGDQSVVPGLRRMAHEAAKGQSMVGSWGHGYAQPDGRLGGYGMMNQPGLSLTTGLILARKAGIQEPWLDNAIERSLRLLRFYIGKGSIPYGDHDPWIQNHDDNGKNGIGAEMFNLIGETKGAEFFSHMALACHGAERDTGHTGNFFNILWAMPGVAQSGPNATGAWMKEFGSWYYDLSRRADGGFVHLGPPNEDNDAYAGWDCTGAILLAYAMPLKAISLTGQGGSGIRQLTAEEANQYIDDGRGWTNKDRYSFYDGLTTDELFARLGSGSPVVRERAAIALSRRKQDVVQRLIDLIDGPDLETRYGVRQALKLQGERAAAAVPALVKSLDHTDDLWLRILTAQALVGIGEPARPALPKLLEKIAGPAAPDDPRKMEQRYYCYALFAGRGGLLSKSLDGVDRDLLFKAVPAALQNEDGRARGLLSSVYRQLSYDDLKPILPDIYQATAVPSPSGIMFNHEIQMAGMQLFTANHVDENIDLLAHFARHMKKHGSEHRIVDVMNMLKSYGARAKRVIPQLKDAADYYQNHETDFPHHLSLEKAKVIRDAVAEIEASTDTPAVIHLKK